MRISDWSSDVCSSDLDIDDSRELARVVAEHPADSEAEVTISHDGSEQTLTVVTGQKPAPERMAEASGPTQDGAYHSSALDAELAALTPELRAGYGIPESAEGGLVLDIEEDQVVEQRLCAGEVVTG